MPSCVIEYKITVSVIVSAGRTDKNGSFLGYCQYGSVLPNLAAVCASIYHTVHTLTLTLNLALISSYLMNKHQYPQPSMSAN